jgi:hypothetical protein
LCDTGGFVARVVQLSAAYCRIAGFLGNKEMLPGSNLNHVNFHIRETNIEIPYPKESAVAYRGGRPVTQ